MHRYSWRRSRVLLIRIPRKSFAWSTSRLAHRGIKMIDIRGVDLPITPPMALRLNRQSCKKVTVRRLLVLAMRESRNLGPLRTAIRKWLEYGASVWNIWLSVGYYIDVNSVINLGKSKTCPFECQYVTSQYRLPLLASIFPIANVQAHLTG